MTILLLIAAIVLVWLAFTWFVKVSKATVSTALVIIVILLLLNFTFGVSPRELLEIVLDLPNTIRQALSGGQ